MMSSSMEEEPFHFFREILAFTIDDKELVNFHNFNMLTLAFQIISCFWQPFSFKTKNIKNKNYGSYVLFLVVNYILASKPVILILAPEETNNWCSIFFLIACLILNFKLLDVSWLPTSSQLSLWMISLWWSCAWEAYFKFFFFVVFTMG